MQCLSVEDLLITVSSDKLNPKLSPAEYITCRRTRPWILIHRWIAKCWIRCCFGTCYTRMVSNLIDVRIFYYIFNNLASKVKSLRYLSVADKKQKCKINIWIKCFHCALVLVDIFSYLPSHKYPSNHCKYLLEALKNLQKKRLYIRRFNSY